MYASRSLNHYPPTDPAQFRSGLYPSATGYPLILGQEGAGTIAAVTSENPQGFREGDKVVWIKQGGYAEYTAVPSERVIKLPPGLAEDQAVGGFLMGMTALSLIREAYPVKKGDKVLVHAAAGGVGLLLCQLLKQAGAYIIGTAGSAEKCKLAEEHGADKTINYNEDKSWPLTVKEFTDSQGVDVVYDSVGATTWEGSLEAVKRKGKGLCSHPHQITGFANVMTSRLLRQCLWTSSASADPKTRTEKHLRHESYGDELHRHTGRA